MSRTNHITQSWCWACEFERNPCRAWMSKEPHTCHPFRSIDGRRPWKRKSRYPSWMRGQLGRPSRWWWKNQHSRARAVYRQMMFRSNDPVLPREQDLIDLYSWY